MRARIIDAALLLGLVAVAAGIMWTLFNLGTSPRSPASPPPAAAGPASEPPGVVVVPPDAAAPGREGAAPTMQGVEDAAAPAVTAPDSGAPETGVTETGAPAPGAAAPDAAAPGATPPPRVVPAGAVELERVGFSFVTGGPGACGMVLEPWTHVAVSRELLETYGCGARVRVTLDDEVGGRTAFDGVIGDTMPPQIVRTLNVYVGTDEPAFQYGVTTGTVAPAE